MDKNEKLELRRSLNEAFYEVKPDLQSCEVLRRKYFQKIIVRACLIIFMTLFLVLIYLKFPKFWGLAIFPVLVLEFLILLLFYRIPSYRKEYSNEIKSKYKNKFAKVFDLQYITKETLKITKFWNYLPSQTTEFDDIFHGKYKNTEFAICEERNFVNIIFQTNKIVKTKTQLISKNRNRNILTKLFIILALFSTTGINLFLGGNSTNIVMNISITVFLGILFILIISFNVVVYYWREIATCNESITTESTELQKNFEVVGDQIEGRYGLTTGFIERVNEMNRAFRGKKIICTLEKDMIRFEIEKRGDMFEFGELFEKADSPKCIEKFYREVTAIYEMIEHFRIREKRG